MKKRFLALLLALVMVFSFSFAAFAAEPNQDSSNVSAKTFPDMPNDWSTEALNAAINNGLMQGTDQGKLEPQSNLKRVEMAIMINRAFNATEFGSLEGFTDVNTGHWFYAELQKSIQMKTFKGDQNRKLNPEDFITRQDAFLVLARALDVKPVALTQAEENALFNDAQSIDFWAKGEVLALAKAKLIKGYNGKVNPRDNITRAEFAQVMFNCIKHYITQAGTVTSVPAGNVMVNVADVVLKDLTINGDLIIGDGVGNGTVTLDNVKVTGRVVVRGGGINSVIIKGNSTIGSISIVKTATGGVRVFAEDGSTVEMLQINDGKDQVVLKGAFGAVNVNSGVPVQLTGATATSINANSADSKVSVDENSTVKTLTVTGAATSSKIDVAGTVNTVATSSKETTLNVTGTVTRVGTTKDATGAKVNVGASGTATSIVTAGPGTTVSNDGKIGNLLVSEEAKGSKLVVGDNSTLTNIVTADKKDLKVTTVAAEKAAAEKIAADKAAAAAKTDAEKAAAAQAQAAAQAATEKAAAAKAAAEAAAAAKTEVKPVNPPVVDDKGDGSIVIPEQPSYEDAKKKLHDAVAAGIPTTNAAIKNIATLSLQNNAMTVNIENGTTLASSIIEKDFLAPLFAYDEVYQVQVGSKKIVIDKTNATTKKASTKEIMLAVASAAGLPANDTTIDKLSGKTVNVIMFGKTTKIEYSDDYTVIFK